MSDIPMLTYGVHIPHNKLRRELNQWLRWLSQNPENSVIVTKNGRTVARLMTHSVDSDILGLPLGFVKDILTAVEEEKTHDVSEYKLDK